MRMLFPLLNILLYCVIRVQEESRNSNISVKIFYYFIPLQVRQKGEGVSYKGKIGGNDATCVFRV